VCQKKCYSYDMKVMYWIALIILGILGYQYINATIIHNPAVILQQQVEAEALSENSIQACSKAVVANILDIYKTGPSICVMDVAVHTGNPSLCPQVSIVNDEVTCYTRLAAKLHNVNLCENISSINSTSDWGPAYSLCLKGAGQ
jgi:hypothetical protein